LALYRRVDLVAGYWLYMHRLMPRTRKVEFFGGLRLIGINRCNVMHPPHLDLSHAFSFACLNIYDPLFVGRDDQNFLNGQSPPQVTRAIAPRIPYKLFQVSRKAARKQRQFGGTKSADDRVEYESTRHTERAVVEQRLGGRLTSNASLRHAAPFGLFHGR
jgi:hypothetical protein